ncbi:LLM class flavin-dependent oxidoreductase [Dactylosporangium maewongense]|uniref:LLM class flavin-dependent oxidoreductase n=1 Tax=Dactylosporangium maewongense TaxID=634393 RepID=A0ABN2BGD3_9ACTN
MTADPGTGIGPAGGALRVDAFLLAGQFPGAGHGDALRAAVTYAQAAERAGFDGVWLAEHHFVTYGTCPSAVAMAGFVLGRTHRLRVGTAAANLSNRHPVALAEEAALLDAVSGGRFDLGVARGGPWVDLEVFGTGLDRYSPDGFAEALDVLLATLGGAGTVRGEGARFGFRTVPVVPRPPRALPVWVAATSPSTVDLAAGRGLPLLLGVHDTDTGKADLILRHAQPGAGHVSAHLAYVADTTAQAEDVLRDTLPTWLARAGEHVRIDGTTTTRNLADYVEHLLAIHPVGPPDRCVRRLAGTLTGTGVRRVLLMVEAGGTPERTIRNIDRFGAEVLPVLRRLPAAAQPPAGQR